MPAPHASVDIGTVRQRFNFDWAMSEPVDGVDTYWWWARSIRVDPNEVIADDDEGGLWSIPFTTDGADIVTFGEPVKVRETYVPVQAPDGAAATALVQRRGQKATAFDKPAKEPKSTPSAASEPPAPEEAHMPEITPDQVARLRALPEDADQAQIDAAMSGTQPDPAPGQEPEPTSTPEAELVPAAASAKTVTVSEDQWKTTNDRLAAAETRLNERDQQDAKIHRDGLIARALREGRITPAEQADWRKDLDKWPEATEAALGRLQPGRVPMEERGAASTGPDPDNPLGNGITSTGWFPQLASKEA